MTPLLLALLTVAHVLAGVFWAGTTFVLARTGGALADRLAQPQLGSAVLALLAGVALFGLLHGGGVSRGEAVLGLGALCAIAAAGVQLSALGAVGRLKDPQDAAAARRVALSQRLAAALLAVTVACMVAFRYA